MMNNEDFERKVEFLVNQQARFDANMHWLEEAQAQTAETANRTAAGLERLIEDVTQLTGNVAQLTGTVADLASLTTAGFRATLDRFNDVNVKIDILVDSQIRSDERIQNLIAMFDRHINEGHHGGQRPGALLQKSYLRTINEPQKSTKSTKFS